MNTCISHESPAVFFKDGRLVTTSHAVADYFDKQHKDVLRKIDNLDCSPEFTSAHFCAHVENQIVGVAEREIRYFEVTKDGFMFLVMGFTGKKAARLKEAYISKFNAMEAELHSSPTSGRRGSYSIVVDFENDLPICSRLLSPGEIVMSYESFMEHALRMGNVVLPCDEVGKFTMDELQEMTAQARRTRDHWQKQYSELERKYSC